MAHPWRQTQSPRGGGVIAPGPLEYAPDEYDLLPQGPVDEGEDDRGNPPGELGNKITIQV